MVSLLDVLRYRLAYEAEACAGRESRHRLSE
jgi:hypothetical protein